MSTLWSEDSTSYQLSESCSLERANLHEFAVHQTIYREADPILLQNWDRSLAMIADSQFLTTRAFWIREGQRRLGSVIMSPNFIGNLVLQPPFCDVGALLRLLKKLLVQWSDPRQSITASAVLPGQVEHYERLGFRRSDINRCMIRPTERFTVAWEDDLRLSAPHKEEKEDDLTALFYRAFSDLGIGDQTVESRRKAVRHYLSRYADVDILSRASTCVRESQSGQLVAACLISLWENWPLVFDVAVHPAWRRRGIAKRMLKQALTTLAGDYPALRLFVAVGNEAESLYHGLGFLPGPAITNLKLHAPH